MTDEQALAIALPDSLRATRIGRVAVLRLTRPEKRNSLNDEIIEGIETFFFSLPDDTSAVLLAAEGEHFCAGLDLSEIRERNAVEGAAHSALWHRAFERIQFGRVPVVAVLHGAVVGGGLELAAACHVRVAERTAFYALPEGIRGIFVGGGGSVRIPRLIGAARMTDMMLTGRTYSAEDGQHLGISTYLVDSGEGFAKGMALAQQIATNAPLTNFAVMQVLPRIAESGRAAGFALEAAMSAMAQADPEAKKRLRDFLEKRAPKVTPR